MTTLQDDPHIAATTEIREGEYGEAIVAIEPGGAEFIPLSERHGKPLNLFWTWMSPNFEFATVFVGVLAVILFGMTFWQAVAGIVLGTVLGSASMGALSARGPQYGAPQMVLSRISFGYWGNVLPAGINSVIAGVGWFAVNSVSGALALNTLFHVGGHHLNKVLCLLIIVVAQIAIALIGHNLIHVFERYVFPLLVVAFALGAIWTFKDAKYGAGGGGGVGGFLLTVGAAFGYAAGWNPYASDYTRYMAPETDKKAVAWWSGFGVALSCIALEVVGAASGTLTGAAGFAGPGPFVSPYPRIIRDLVLLSIAVGAVAANALNIYSGAISFTTLGIKLPLKFRRALIAGVFGVAGFFVAWSGLHDAGEKYTDFLLIIAYWIGPWLAVFFVDQLIRRGNHADKLYDSKYENWAGPIAMAVGMVVSIALFSNQAKYVAWVPKHHPKFGDLTFEVGFIVSATVYYVLYRAIGNKQPAVVELPD